MTVPLNRRRLLATTLAATLAGCVGPLGTIRKRQRRIGMLSSGPTPSSDHIAAFHEGMRSEDLIADVDYVLAVRAADGHSDQLLPLAEQLVAQDPDVLLAVTTGSTQAARAVTSSVPIVMVSAHDPVEAGVVASLARPGGNVTGQSLMGGDLMPKQLELLSEARPIRRLAYLTPDVPSPASGYPSVTDVFERTMRQKAAALGIDVRTFTMRDVSEMDQVIAAVAAQDVEALYVIESPIWGASGAQRPLERVIELAIRRRLPSIAGLRAYAAQGLLLSYGDARPQLDRFRGVSRFVAQILRGTAPGEIPVERPTRFELAVNIKTAMALGLTLPRTLLDRVDVVIH